MDISTLIESLDDALDPFPVIAYDPHRDILTLITERCPPRLNENPRSGYLTLYSRWDCRVIGFSLHETSGLLAHILTVSHETPFRFSHLLNAAKESLSPFSTRCRSFVEQRPLIRLASRLFGNVEIPSEILPRIRPLLVAI